MFRRFLTAARKPVKEPAPEALVDDPDLVAKSAEFIMRNRFPTDLDPELPIEVECSEANLVKLLDRVQAAWEHLGSVEPYWSVVSAEEFRTASFQNNEKAFWEKGHYDFIRLPAWAKRNHIDLTRYDCCLEYGCGVGRITKFLSGQFKTVHALDISQAHLNAARQCLPSSSYAGVQFHHLVNLSQLDRLPRFDVLFSIIVLQHNPPPVIAYTLKKLLTHLRPNGIAYFQVPTFRRGYSFQIDSYLRQPENHGMEMHILPQRYVFEIAQSCHCSVLEVQPDNMVWSMEFVSSMFLLQKRS